MDKQYIFKVTNFEFASYDSPEGSIDLSCELTVQISDAHCSSRKCAIWLDFSTDIKLFPFIE